MGSFDAAMAFTEKWEGGFVDDPKDPGGATKYGISLRFLRGLAPQLGDVDGDGDIDADDILALTPDMARNLYRVHFWDALGLDHLPQAIALPMFDTAVNMGHRRATRILQEALRDTWHPVAVDGVLGPVTKDAARKAVMYRPDGFGDRFCLRRMGHYAVIIAANSDLGRFAGGWVNRTVALSDEIRKEVW